MSNSEFNRRQLQRLTLAAFGGMMAGASVAQAKDEVPKKDKDKNPLLGEPHVCRGLNVCKALGVDKKNACAVRAFRHGESAHVSHAQRMSRPGRLRRAPRRELLQSPRRMVPLMDKTWDKARKRFEELMKKDKKEFGEAPPKKKK